MKVLYIILLSNFFLWSCEKDPSDFQQKFCVTYIDAQIDHNIVVSPSFSELIALPKCFLGHTVNVQGYLVKDEFNNGNYFLYGNLASYEYNDKANSFTLSLSEDEKLTLNVSDSFDTVKRIRLTASLGASKYLEDVKVLEILKPYNEANLSH